MKLNSSSTNRKSTSPAAFVNDSLFVRCATLALTITARVADNRDDEVIDSYIRTPDKQLSRRKPPQKNVSGYSEALKACPARGWDTGETATPRDHWAYDSVRTSEPILSLSLSLSIYIYIYNHCSRLHTIIQLKNKQRESSTTIKSRTTITLQNVAYIGLYTQLIE